MAILEMHSSNSYCFTCLRTYGKTANASPRENGHYTLLGYGDDNGQPGCGAEWTKVWIMTSYGLDEEDMAYHVRQMYPNLAHLPIVYAASEM